MDKRQRGVTLIGWLFLLIPIAVLSYAAIRLTPIFLNYMNVARSIQQTAAEVKSGDVGSEQLIRSTLQKHFDIESIGFPNVKDVTIRRDGQNWVIEAKYQDTAPLFLNLSLLVDFDKIATVGGPAGG